MSCSERKRLIEKVVGANRALRLAADKPPIGKNYASEFNSLRTARDIARAEAWAHLMEHRCFESLSSALTESNGGKMNLEPTRNLVAPHSPTPSMRLEFVTEVEIARPDPAREVAVAN
jgi:hypothetical protein